MGVEIAVQSYKLLIFDWGERLRFDDALNGIVCSRERTAMDGRAGLSAMDGSVERT